MAKKDNGLTPMMKQFFTLKAKHPDALMLFRCGDFYETYCEDAVAAAKILGITLTRRNNGGSTGTTEMAIIFLVILVMAAGIVIYTKKRKVD